MMFSSSAHEAYFVSLGTYINSGITRFLASNDFFKAVMIFIVSVTLLIILIQRFSLNLPGTVFERRYVSLGKFAKFMVSFFLGVSILQVAVKTDIKDYSRRSWQENSFYKSKVSPSQKDVKIAFIFDILIRTIEEIGWGATKVVDSIMSGTHSNLKAPQFFYKALMYAGASEVKDPKLRSWMMMYSRDCVMKALAEFPESEHKGWIGRLFSGKEMPNKIHSIYEHTRFERKDGTFYDCNDLRISINKALYKEAIGRAPTIIRLANKVGLEKIIETGMFSNMIISSSVLNFYRSNREDWVGTKKEAEVPGLGASILQFVEKFTSFEGILRFFNREDLAGMSLAIDKAQEFNELQRKAPIIKGLVKMFLIGFAPLLVFAIFAMNLKVIIWWVVAYSSVTIGWSVAWNFLYHVMTNYVASGNILNHFGLLSDGYSLSAANLIMEDAYYFYSVIFMAQVFSAIAITGGSLFFTRNLLADMATDHSPAGIDGIAKGALQIAVAKGMT